MKFSRRDFIATSALASLALAADSEAAPSAESVAGSGKNILISSLNGLAHLESGHAQLRSGADTLQAAITVVTAVENDPLDDSVGLGGLPNEEGVVELDASCMHGPTRRAGAVGAVQKIKNVASLARTVMERTGHVMLAGDGARRFALAEGFTEESLLTEHARKVWLLWKETTSRDHGWWGPGMASPEWKIPDLKRDSSRALPPAIQRMYDLAADLGILPDERFDAIHKVLHPPTGTINCSALNARGEMSGVTTTSGLAFKIPGRLGDSPIIGAGCYCDQDVGSAGATGSGEENIKVAGAHTIVENMRKGMSPEEAGMDALKRIVRNYENDMSKIHFISMKYYILRKDGAYAGVSMWSGTTDSPASFAVHDGKPRREKCVALFQGAAAEWPPYTELPF